MTNHSLIDTAKIVFDFQSTFFKKPFGALPASHKNLTLRMLAGSHQLAIVKVRLTKPDGRVSFYEMHLCGKFDGLDLFQIEISKNEFIDLGVYRYKFICANSVDVVECGVSSKDDAKIDVLRGNVDPFELTVYDREFSSPTWFRRGVAYQIFVDRFFDGEKGNNRAKLAEGCTGKVRPGETPENKMFPVKYFDSETLGDKSSSQNAFKPDGFDVFWGGDLQGVEKKLDYLSYLGVDILYLSPINWSPSNHKYDASDYHHLDPSFGIPVFNEQGDPSSGINYAATREVSDRFFKSFANLAKARGFSVILDGVFNHCGADSVYFDRYERYPEIGAYPFWRKVWDRVNHFGEREEEAKSNVIDDYCSQINPATGKYYRYPQDFRYINWFDIRNEKFNQSDIYQYECWFRFDHMPSIKQCSPETGDAVSIEGLHSWNNRDFRQLVLGEDLHNRSECEAQALMQAAAAQKWAWMGSAGWRLDAVPMVSKETWKMFCRALRSTALHKNHDGGRVKEQVAIGEVWDVKPEYLLGDSFDSLTNYPLKIALDDFMLHGDALKLHKQLEQIREKYPPNAWMSAFNILDSHDTERLTTLYLKSNNIPPDAKLMEAQNLARKHLKLAVIFLMAYPGVPNIYYGDEVGLDGSYDPDNRKPFPWDRVCDDDGDFTVSVSYRDLFRICRRAILARRKYRVFIDGNLTSILTDGDCLIYLRRIESECGLLLINRGLQEKVLKVDVSNVMPDHIQLADVIGESKNASVEGGIFKYTLPALHGIMLVGENQSLPSVCLRHVRDNQLHDGTRGTLVEWQPVEGADYYKIYRGLSPFETGDNHYSLAIRCFDSSCRFFDANGEQGMHYAVAACNGVAESTTFSSACEVRSLNRMKNLMLFEASLPSEHHRDLPPVKVAESEKHIAISWENLPLWVRRSGIQKRVSGESYMDLSSITRSQEVYCDFLVNPNENYHYRMFAIDSSGKRFHSSEVPAKASEELVDVTIRVHVPGYTPTDSTLYISGEFNNYNISTHSLDGSYKNRNMWVYRFRAAEGDSFKNYSFFRDKSLYKSGFMSLTRDRNDKHSCSNWAYFDFETNQSIIVQNQGKGEMVVDEYILRWMDLPLVFFQPVFSIDESVRYETREPWVRVVASVPFDTLVYVDGILTAEDHLGEVEFELPLKTGENNFVIETCCSEAHKSYPWALNDWHTDFAKRRIELTITRG